MMWPFRKKQKTSAVKEKKFCSISEEYPVVIKRLPVTIILTDNSTRQYYIYGKAYESEYALLRFCLYSGETKSCRESDDKQYIDYDYETDIFPESSIPRLYFTDDYLEYMDVENQIHIIPKRRISEIIKGTIEDSSMIVYKTIYKKERV